jgi:hypothetical protein
MPEDFTLYKATVPRPATEFWLMEAARCIDDKNARYIAAGVLLLVAAAACWLSSSLLPVLLLLLLQA